MKRILPIVTSVLIFSFAIVACTSAADSGGNKTPTTSTDTTQAAPVPTETASSLSTNPSDPAKAEANGKEESKSNTADANQKEKTAKPTNSKTESPTTPKAPTTPEKSKTPAKPTPETPSNSSLSSAEQEVVRLVNIERQKAGLHPLVADTKISSVARVKSQDMIDNRYFNHQSPRYGSPFDMMSQFGIRYRTAGENIAGGQSTPAEVMKSWMNSPGHRANILSRDFTKIGVGFAKGGSYGVYWTQQFTG
ncbi:putative YkwD family protein [Croceifilum oryzae]|uniref:YkwD family protein n=1 Tax=Croceifilum oryzae TaxID=1553429 RepID=A0AAJ1WSB7_9BACL|nr:CAP domain-containing protein [Croceifilum oryzae]MDQ0416848.1 putative YkwD family protein [Croceifilum oryzae]